jgi:SAM-dependent methyltransferase
VPAAREISADRPNARLALAKYRKLADEYDRRTARIEPFRRRAIERLLLTSGQTVLEAACGTGVNFALLERYVGPRGRIIGVDLSPEMLEAARARVAAQRWRNVELIEAPVELADIPGQIDAAIFSFAHDVLRSPRAVERVVGAVRRGGRVVAVGAQWAPRWRWPVNVGVRLVARRYVTTFEGLGKPWDQLERALGRVQVETLGFGAIYVVTGVVAES